MRAAVAPVARMERSEIRDRPAPDFAALHPGYSYAGADNACRQQSPGPYAPAAILSPSAADANSPIRARLIAAVRVGEAIFAPMRSVT